jgi:hypothetical protein
MKVELAVSVVEFPARHLVVVVEQVFRVGSLAALVGKDVFGGDTSVNGRERGVVVVERRTSLIVDERRRGEVRLSRVVILLPPSDDALYSVGGFVTSVLDEIRLKPRFGPHVVVGFALEFGLARSLVLALPRMVDDVVSGPQELGDGFVEGVGVAVGHVEFDGDGATYLHPCFSVQ